MSIPRDLKVDIPGYGIAKFNAAYTYGGPKLTLRLVKELTGLEVNHVVNVDFLGFVRAVNAIGCVYTDVDRRYYHSNEGVPPSEQYSEIDIEPGYQRLCGKQALAYVRYRHTDTDLVRSARQQAFLSAARQQVPISQLVLGQGNLIDIFTKYTTSDINNAEEMLDLLKLFIASRNASVKEIHFPATLGPAMCMRRRARSTAPPANSWARPAGRRRASAGSRSGAEKKALRARPPARQAQARRRRRTDPRLRSRQGRGGRGRPPRRLPSRSSTRPGCPRGRIRARLGRRTHAKPLRLPPPRHRRPSPRGLPDGAAVGPCPKGSPTSGCRGSGGGQPADPQQPGGDRDARRPPVRDLHQRRQGQDGRLAPGRRHLLGLQQPAQHAEQRPDGRHGPIDERDNPQAEATEGAGDDGRAGAGRRDRRRLGRPGDGGLLRRARPPGDRARHRARRRSSALSRGETHDPRARPRRAAAPQRRAPLLHHRDRRAARRGPAALRLRRHAADLLRGRRPLAGPLGGRGASPRRRPRADHEEHRAGRHRRLDPARRSRASPTSPARSSSRRARRSRTSCTPTGS